jgi:colanic acid biosynthesis glycosyl transferase WcaI
MNIVLICYVYPPEVQASAMMVRELAEDLTAAGHRVTVLTGWPSHPGGLLYPGWRARFRHTERDQRGFVVLRCGHAFAPRSRPLRQLWYYFTFAVSTFVNGLAAGPFDAVLCLSTPIFGSWSAWLLARLKGARFVYDIFDLHPEAAESAGLMRKGLLYRLWWWQDTLLCRASDVLLTLGHGMKRLIEARGIPGEEVAIVPFWIDADRIRPGPRDNAWRRAQKIPPEKFVALYAGTIGSVSGAGILAEAAERLRDRPDILLLCVGEGMAKDDLMRRAHQRHLANIKFLPFQPEEVLADMQATADVGLVTLLPEAGKSSIPSKVLGYMAAGRPVIASVALDSDTAEMVREAKCGLVVPPQDAAALADAIRRAADDRERVKQMGRNARRCLIENYSRAACTRTYERLFMGRASEGDDEDKAV